MKKKSLFIIALIAFCFLNFINPKAEGVANWEFLPNGINYIEDENFSFTRGTPINRGVVNTINYVRVKPSTTYYVYFRAYQEGRFNGSTITAYSSEKESLGTLSSRMNGEATSISFTTGSNCKYVKLVLNVEEDWGCDLNLESVEENIVMTDHEINLSSYSDADLAYKGPIIDYSPVISGQNGYYITNVDNPTPFETIMSGIKAIDDNDGDITDKIVIDENSYSNNMNKVGTWKIKLSVSDSSNNTSHLTIFINVIDNVAPVVTGKTSFEIKTTDDYLITDFYPLLLIIDNYDGNISNNFVIINDEYTANKKREGQYNVTGYVVDSSNNRTDVTFVVKVKNVDVESPIVTGTFSYNVSSNQVISTSEILSNLSAVDNVDGNISDKIKIKFDNYSHAPSRVGSWIVTISVSDSNGNITEKDIIITVTDGIPPLFYINTQVINIDLQNNTLEISDFVNFMKRTNQIKENVSYRVSYDEYSDNKNKAGEYKIILDIDGEPLALKINVIDQIYGKKKTLWQRIIDFTNNVFNRVVNFFKKTF